MKRIFPLAVAFGLIFWTVRRLNRLVFEVQTQGAQIEDLKAQSEALKAVLEAQRLQVEAMEARREEVEAAILAGAKERIARWQQHLSDLDAPN